MKRFYDVVQDEAGNIVSGAEMYVRDQDDSSLVALFSDNGITATANPVVSGTDGYVSFWTADNVLKLEVYIDGELEKTISYYQHFDAEDNEIKALRSVTSAADKLFYFTGVGTGAVTAFTSFGRSLVDDADAAAALTTLGISSFAQTILDDADVGTVRTTIGVGTGDSPQFTALNLGHANDTTLTRVSAGVVAIEGVTVMTVAGGTFTGDIIVPDDAYDASGWNNNNEAPTKNAVRDKIETLGGSISAAALTRRGSTKATGTSNSLVVSFHASAAAGDTAVMFAASAGQIATPSGWYLAESGYKNNTGGWETVVFYKILTSGDISTGSVTLSLELSARCQAMMVVYQGTANVSWTKNFHIPVYRISFQASSDGYATPKLLTNEVLLMGITCRGNSANTSDIGSQLQNDQQSDGSMALYEYVLPDDRMAKAVINIPGSGSFDTDMPWLALRG